MAVKIRDANDHYLTAGRTRDALTGAAQCWQAAPRCALVFDDETAAAACAAVEGVSETATIAPVDSVRLNGAYLEGTFGIPAFHSGPVTLFRTICLENPNPDDFHWFITAVFQGAANLCVLHTGHTGDDPTSLRLYIAEGSQDPAWALADAVGKWLHVCLIVDGVNGTITSYVREAGGSSWLIQRTDDYDDQSQQAVERLGRRTPNQEGPEHVRIAKVATWEAALSEQEILAECAQRLPAKLDGLHSYFSCDHLPASPWEWQPDLGDYVLNVEAGGQTPSPELVASQPTDWNGAA